jgi:CDP-diacylglycerol--serine O-phosphatidyltransferase
MDVRRQPRLKGLHINRMIPNVLTLLALAAGLTAIKFALQQRWELAVLAIVAAGILDGLDGRIARILKGASRFGAELDSLSDFLCFGVAPALILYLWGLTASGGLGWALVLLLCMCCALRLARFNTDLETEATPAWSRNFFVGVPSPAGAGVVLMPMLLWFEVDSDLIRNPTVIGLFMVVGGVLLVSRIRTFSFKKVRVAYNWVLPAMLSIGLYLALFVSNPWITLLLTMVAYLGSIPFSIRAFKTGQRRFADSPPSPPSSANTGDSSVEPVP